MGLRAVWVELTPAGFVVVVFVVAFVGFGFGFFVVTQRSLAQ